MHAKAVALGFDGVADLLDRTRHLNDVQFGDIVGLKQGPAATFRRRHGRQPDIVSIRSTTDSLPLETAIERDNHRTNEAAVLVFAPASG
jgi:hypothetical protein